MKNLFSPILLILCIFLNFNFSFAQTGSIYVTSKPPGAKISLDGYPLPKKTDTLIKDIPLGPHKIIVELSGFEKIEKSVVVKEGLTNELHLNLQIEKPRDQGTEVGGINEAEAYYKGGLNYVERGQYDLAITNFSKAIQLDPTFRSAFFSRGLAYFEKGKYDLAITDCTMAVDLGLNEKGPFLIRGSAYIEKGQYDLANADLAKALAIDPKDSSTYYKRSLLSLLKGEYKLAVADLKKGIELNPKAGTYHFDLAFALYQMGDRGGAKKHFLKAKELDKMVVEKKVELLEKTIHPNLRKFHVDILLTASQYLDVSSRVVAKAKEMVEETPVPSSQKSFFKTIDRRWILFSLIILLGAILLGLAMKFMLRKKETTLEAKESLASTDSVKSTTPISCLRMTIPEKSMGALPSTTIDKYQILEKIASGGMANIYKATHMTQGSVVVLKVPYEQFQNDTKFVERFRREAELGKKLHNENIIHIFESGINENGIAYIAMEYVDGMDLRRYLNKYKRVPLPEALEIIVCICRALDYAHIKEVIHRDIKPENIMIPHEWGKGRVVLMDFGVAHTTYLCTLATRSTFIGTPYYMSPDQLSGEEIDARSDIYSLGIVFFEMVTGQRPFNDKDPLKVLIQHQKTPPPRPSSLNPEISPEFETIILKMLAKNPEDRYQNVETLLNVLQEYMLKEGIKII